MHCGQLQISQLLLLCYKSRTLACVVTGPKHNSPVHSTRLDGARCGVSHHEEGELPDRDVEQGGAGPTREHPMLWAPQEVHTHKDVRVEPALVPLGLHVWGGFSPQTGLPSGRQSTAEAFQVNIM